jgi:hypothetical protein
MLFKDIKMDRLTPEQRHKNMPILDTSGISFSDIAWNGISYADILKQLKPDGTYVNCHVDPDIRENRVEPVKGWKPAFGQCQAAEGQLRNAEVEPGDIFLFFGWFRRVEETAEGYKYVKRSGDDFYSGNDLQVIYGYMQVCEKITDQEQIRKYYWHPHSSDVHTGLVNNVLYLPTDKLSIAPNLKGYGTLDYCRDRVLTMKGKGRATWNDYSFLMPEHVYGHKKNSAKDGGLYYAGQWQELIINESKGLREWVTQVVS